MAARHQARPVAHMGYLLGPGWAIWATGLAETICEEHEATKMYTPPFAGGCDQPVDA